MDRALRLNHSGYRTARIPEQLSYFAPRSLYPQTSHQHLLISLTTERLPLTAFDRGVDPMVFASHSSDQPLQTPAGLRRLDSSAGYTSYHRIASVCSSVKPLSSMVLAMCLKFTSSISVSRNKSDRALQMVSRSPFSTLIACSMKRRVSEWLASQRNRHARHRQPPVKTLQNMLPPVLAYKHAISSLVAASIFSNAFLS